MKSWLHTHRLRRHRSETQLLPIQCHDPEEVQEIVPVRPVKTTSKQVESAAKIAASKTSSRMSIERYLSAPLEEEPASVPAINAALQGHVSKKQPRAPPPALARIGHSRDTSIDANSDGRRTFYTSGSGPDSTVTSFSAVSKVSRTAQHHARSTSHPKVPELPRPEVFDFDNIGTTSPERPMTSGTVDAEKTWADQMGNLTPGSSPEDLIDYRLKAEQEMAKILERAKELEESLKLAKSETEINDGPPTRVTDAMAYAQMEARPKLAWILGTGPSDVKSVERPRSSASHMAERPFSSVAFTDSIPHRQARRTKSNGALDERAKQAAVEKRSAGFFERKTSKRARFYCTFCQKRFHSRLEWMRHEQTLHMPEELWVCCPRTGEFPDRCPFCAKDRPSPSHLADHNYLSCQQKPLSERTFGRQDHFLQHISQVHKVSPSQKPVVLTELLEAWKHPLPLKQGHQALHCGFCGQAFSSYKDRTEHVGAHFVDGLDMMSWWSGRVNHDVPHPKPSEAMHQNPDLPHKCCYCERVYENLAVAQKLHSACTMWSCSFLPGMQYTIYPRGARDNLEAVCCFCNESLVQGVGKVKGSILKEHIHQHNFRNCNQRLYFSSQRFRQHLQDNHKSTFDGTLFAGWTLLLKSSKRQKPSIFEPVTAATSVRRAYTDPGQVEVKPKRSDKPPQLPQLNFMDLTDTPQRPAPKQKIRRKKSVQTMPDKPIRVTRNSGLFFTRAATVDLAYGTTASPSPNLDALLSPRELPPKHRPGFPMSSLPTDAVNTCPKFYRRRLDASTRNRLYVRDEDEGPLSVNSQRLFRKVPGSLFGGLVLHSSLVGSVPARMTNSVDIYSIH